MGISKVEFDGETLIDLTNDTVTEDNLLAGYSAHNRAGELIQGLLQCPTKVSQLENDSGYAKIVDVVKRCGDEMSGNLYIHKGDPYLVLKNSNGNHQEVGLHYYGSSAGNNVFGVYDINNNRHLFYINQSDRSIHTYGIINTPHMIKAGEKALLFSDNEGGNLRLIAPDGTSWEIDAVDGNLRIFSWDESYNYNFAVTIGKNGVFYPKRISTIGYIGSGHGNILTSDSGAIFMSYFSAYRVDSMYILKIDGRIEKVPSPRNANTFTAKIDKNYILNTLGIPTSLNLVNSTCQYFLSNGTLINAAVERGGCLDPNGRIPGRYYSDNFLYGAWPTNHAIYNLNTLWHIECLLQ